MILLKYGKCCDMTTYLSKKEWRNIIKNLHENKENSLAEELSDVIEGYEDGAYLGELNLKEMSKYILRLEYNVLDSQVNYIDSPVEFGEDNLTDSSLWIQEIFHDKGVTIKLDGAEELVPYFEERKEHFDDIVSFSHFISETDWTNEEGVINGFWDYFKETPDELDDEERIDLMIENMKAEDGYDDLVKVEYDNYLIFP